MPVYVYRNLKTQETFEVEQRITEDAWTAHPESGDPVKRLVQPVGIAFRGSGFYVTDSRRSGNGKARSKDGSDASSGSASDGASGAGKDGASAKESSGSGEASSTGTDAKKTSGSTDSSSAKSSGKASRD
ncbi:MAG: hypothetical protein WD336_08335 [Trueperaceae bacterium]